MLAQQTTWKCTKKTKSVKCSGSVRLGCNFLIAKAHNHPGDMKKVTELRVKSKVGFEIATFIFVPCGGHKKSPCTSI